MSTSLNILSRPKRAVHSKKLVITEEIAQILANESDSDESFIPEPSKKSINSSQSKDDSLKTNSSSESNESEEEGEDKLIAHNNSTDTADKSDVKKDEIENDKKRQKVEKKPRNKIKETNKKTDKSAKQATKKRKRKSQKANQQNQIENEENKKILDKISSKFKHTHSTYSYTGPCVKLDTTKTDLNYQTYIICNRLESTESNTANDKSINDSQIRVPKEKQQSIINQSGPWLCTLCLNRPNHQNLGDLYGPYLISPDLDDSNNSVNMKKDDKKLREVWIHEHCAVWSADIYVEDNNVRGISEVIHQAQVAKCNYCDKFGASLICHRNMCNKKFHYPCAINSKCKFDAENFTITCKNHS